MLKLKPILFKFLEKALIFLSKLGISKKTPGALRIYNFFYRLFWPHKDIIEIQGSKMYVNVDDDSLRMRQTFESYARNRVHEEITTDLFKKVVKEGNIVVDLGANIGYFTLLAAKLAGPKGKVYALEPEPQNYNYLVKNIKLNNYNNVVAFQKAVSDKNGKTKLFICDYDSGHHTINRHNGIEAYRQGRVIENKDFIEIETITLDEFFKGKEETIDVIKMDIEGAEALALTGMGGILKKNKNLKMFIEFFPLLIRNMGSSPEEFIQKLLENYNFSIFIIPDDYNAKGGKMTQIKETSEIMKYCQVEEDHINLFLEHNESNKNNS